MKVKLLTGMVRVDSGRQVSFAPGAVIDVPDDEAERLEAAGLALPLPEPLRQAQAKPKPAKTTRTRKNK